MNFSTNFSILVVSAGRIFSLIAVENFSHVNLFRSYLHEKVVIYEKVVFEAQFKNFFYFMEKPCFVLGIASFLYFKPITNFKSCDVKMNIRMRARLKKKKKKLFLSC